MGMVRRMRIISTEKKVKNKDKIEIFIEEGTSFTVTEEDYISLNLYEDREISEDELNYIKTTVNFRAAKNEAVKYLAYKFRSRKEVLEKLLEEGYESSLIEEVLNELASIGYINDKIYAQKFIFDRSKLKPKSSKLLKIELGMKGIEPWIIEEVLSEYEMDDEVIAEKLTRKKFGKYNFKDEKIIKKVHAFLMHRGFDYDIIKNILQKISME